MERLKNGLSEILTILVILSAFIPNLAFAYTTYFNDGTSANTFGNTTYYSDGCTASTYGSQTYFNGVNCNGTLSTYGNTSYYTGSGNNSFTASTYGNTTYFTGTNGANGTASTYGNTTYYSGNIFNQCPTNATYNSSTGKCYCNAGYVASGSTCVYSPPTCPLNAYYNGSSCTCNYGYVASGGSCITVTQSCQNQYGLYSYGSGSSCYCDAGYAWNNTKTYCVAQSYTYTPPTTVSPTIYTSSPPATTGSSCSSFGSGAVLKGNLCYCSGGYKWNSGITACVVGGTTLQRYLTIGSKGADVVALKNLLAILNLYTGYVSTPFDTDTANAVELFQAAHNIPITGTVGPMTRAAINTLIGGN